MKNYDVNLIDHYEKTVSVCTDRPEQVVEKVKNILFDTDLIEFSDEDFVCGEADIIEHSESGLDDTDKEELEIPVIPDEKFNSKFHSAKVYIDNTDAVLIKEISVSYEDAKDYANKRKKKVRRVHFDKPVTIRVYANL